MIVVLLFVCISAVLLGLAGLGLTVSWATDYRYVCVLRLSVFLARWGEYFALGGMVTAIVSALN